MDGDEGIIEKVNDTGKTDPIKRIFREWDTDGNGYITADELKAVLLRLGMKVPTTSRLLKTVDTNQDGKIDYNELANWLNSGSDVAKSLWWKMEGTSVASCAGVMPASRRPLPEIGALVLVQERLGLGFPAKVVYAESRDNIGLLIDGIKPDLKMRVGQQQIFPLDEALEAGWFPRWEFGHEKDGWRTYALRDSYQIETAYCSWCSKERNDRNEQVVLKGSGKMGDTEIVVRFGPYPTFKTVPHLAAQLNKSSNHIRPVRRTLRDAASVDADSKEGWLLKFGCLPVNVVNEFWSEYDEGGLEESRALGTLQTLVYRKRIADLPEGGARNLARLRYGGPHIDAIAAELGDTPIVVWEWFHGGEHREWKSYRGVECELLERRYQTQANHVLMNGGKPTTDWPSKPLRVLFNVGWTSQGGKYFAGHTQIDLVSRRRRGVRRQEATKGTWDYVFFYWVSKYTLVSAAQIYVEYESYLQKLLENGPAESHVETRTESETRLDALQRACPHFVEPAQDEVPEAFICPIGNTLMLTPAFRKQDPESARMEREVLIKWVCEKGTHPFTHEHMDAADVEIDEALITQIAEWLRSFTESATTSSIAE